MPYAKNMVRQDAYVPHWLVVRGYDARDKKFFVADPVSATPQVHKVDRATLERFINGVPELGGIAVSR